MLDENDLKYAFEGYPLKNKKTGLCAFFFEGNKFVYSGFYAVENNSFLYRISSLCEPDLILDHDKAEKIGWVKPEGFDKKVEPSELGGKSYEIFKQEIENFASDIVTEAKAPIKESPLTKQVGGNHYKDMQIQPAEYCQKNKLGCLESFVIKYTSRHKSKNGKQDILKAIHCLEMLIELEYPENK